MIVNIFETYALKRENKFLYFEIQILAFILTVLKTW